MLQCVAVRCSVLQFFKDIPDLEDLECSVLVYCSIFQCVAVCCSVLQYVGDIPDLEDLE